MTDKLVTELAWQVGNLTQQLKDAHSANAELCKRIVSMRPRECDAVIEIRGVDVGVDFDIESDDEGEFVNVHGYWIGQTPVDDLLNLSLREEAEVHSKLIAAAREEASDARIDRLLAKREAA